MIEILSKTDRPLSSLLDGINNYYSTPEIKVPVTDDTKFEIVKGVLEYTKGQNYKVLDIDGARVTFEDGWALVRASNTGPNLTVRYEAKTEERLKEIEEEFNKVIDKEKERLGLK